MLTLRRVLHDEFPELAVWLKHDFPLRERTPQFLLRRAMRTGLLESWYLINNGKKVGYALCVLPKNRPYVMIQYFAILPPYRSMGLGSGFIGLLDLQYQGKDIVLETEDPDAATRARDYRVRKKRLAFYERNGFIVQQGYRFDQAGVRMLLLVKGLRPVDDIPGLWNECYERLFGPVLSVFVRVYPYPYDAARVRPGVYRHFKGSLYEVVSIARHSETDELMVVYKALYGEGALWVRPAAMWNQMMERGGKRVRRFAYVGK